jgi:molybdate transport system permease protein
MEIPHPVKVIPQSEAWRERPSYPRTRLRTLYRLLSLPLLAFLVLPLLALFLRAVPTDILATLRQPQVGQAILLSLKTTLVATLLTILLGTPLAYALARGLLPLQRLIDTLIDLPTVLPPAVAGLALLMAFGRRGLLGGWLNILGIQIAFTSLAVVLAQTFIAAPFYIKSATVGFSSVDTELEQAAGLDGANNWQILRFVIVPLSWSALLSGSVMTWARALGEFGATIIFAGNFPGRTQTMPLAIYLGFELNLDVALTLSLILVGFSFLALLILKAVLRRDPL